MGLPSSKSPVTTWTLRRKLCSILLAFGLITGAPADERLTDAATRILESYGFQGSIHRVTMGSALEHAVMLEFLGSGFANYRREGGMAGCMYTWSYPYCSGDLSDAGK